MPNGTCYDCEENEMVNEEQNGCMALEGGYVNGVWVYYRYYRWRRGVRIGCVPIEGCDVTDPTLDCCAEEEEPTEPPVLPPLTDNTTEPEAPPVIYGSEPIPDYSYVYTYTNRSKDGITYPEYDIKTTRHVNDTLNFTEGSGDTCPCDLEDWESGEDRINQMVEDVAESAA
jgi:hypothetical protein